MSYRPRRLRAPRPVTVLTYIGSGPPLTFEQAANVYRAWRAVAHKGLAVVDGRDWAVSEVRR